MNQNNIIILCYDKVNSDKEKILKILSEDFNINKNYVNFKLVENLEYNKNKNL